MVTICIDNRKVNLEDVDQRWITNQITGRRSEGSDPCIQITVKLNDINLFLSTSNCLKKAISDRKPNDKEQRIIDWWKQFKLNENDYTCGNLVAFIQQLKKFIL